MKLKLCESYHHLPLMRNGHSISINACGVWEARVMIQVFRKEFRTYIHLD